MSEVPSTAPGEVAGMPKLVLRYRTDPDRIADLLPPGLTPWGEPIVQIGIYCVPVHGEPEFGVSTKIPAEWQGIRGHYSLGIGIDQESAIFVSRETNGQPKFPCSVRFFRLGDRVEASATHQGHTFLSWSGLSLSGTSAGSGGSASPSGSAGSGIEPTAVGDVVDDHEWWVKVSRAVGGEEKSYDFPPHVVHVHSEGVVTHVEPLEGTLVFRPSPWDPYTELLPMTGDALAELVTTRHTGRRIELSGPLDPDAFWPHADTIGGSRWPGERGAPRPSTGGTPR